MLVSSGYLDRVVGRRSTTRRRSSSTKFLGEYFRYGLPVGDALR